jgi:wobble nucleotide-excising tRNase
LIESIRWLQAIGRFDEIRDQELSSLIIVYGENGQGKTTLASIFRSMATANPRLIQARHRQQANRLPKVVLELSENRTSIFDESQWHNPFSKIHIYDDEFVNSNVSSGLEIGSEHRKRLHEVVLGSEGIELDKVHQKAKLGIEEINRCIRNLRDKITTADLKGQELDDFLALERFS